MFRDKKLLSCKVMMVFNVNDLLNSLIKTMSTIATPLLQSPSSQYMATITAKKAPHQNFFHLCLLIGFVFLKNVLAHC